MKPKIKKREKIFQLGNNAIASILKKQVDYYICPICGNIYSNINSLTLEHVPPKSQAGKELVLTCAQCNSQAGHSIDAHLSKRTTLENLGSNASIPQLASFEMGGVQVNAKLGWQDNRITLETSDKTNSPAIYKKFQDGLNKIAKEGTWKGREFSIIPKIQYKHRLATIGDLKSAFLIAFAKFGYQYALHEKLYPIRLQIRNWNKQILEFFSIVRTDNKTHDHKLVLVDKPFSFLIVQLRRRVIFLPWLDSKKDLYDILKETYSTLKWQGFECSLPEKPEFCLDFKHGGSKVAAL